jgi:signal transduction histidine kinase
MSDDNAGRIEVLELLTNIGGLVFETENPLAHAYDIVKQTARSQRADISTLFVVEERSRLVLKGGVAYLRGEEVALPTTRTYYELDWAATSEPNMRQKGLTAFVASTGRPIYVESLGELTNKSRHPAHAGKWDDAIYPDGIDHPDTGFGCLYAVPLRRQMAGSPRDAIIGVLKIERRRSRSAFNEEDRKVFDLVAVHLSLLLQQYFRVQHRVFSDVAHAIGGGLGRSYLQLDICQDILGQFEEKPTAVIQYLRKHLPSAVSMLDRACGRLNTVLEASRDPDRAIEEPIQRLWQSVCSEVELKADTKLDDNHVRLALALPLQPDSQLHLRSLAYHDLSSILGNLLDNAIRYAGEAGLITIEIGRTTDGQTSRLRFSVSDRGQGLRDDILREVKDTNYSETYRLPGTSSGVVRGTGLRRVFGLAKINDWQVRVETNDGTTFELITPDFSQRAQLEAAI